MSAKLSRRLIVLAAVIAALIFIALPVVVTLGLVHLKDVAARVDANQRANTVALCTLRRDLQERVSAGQAFLAKHPEGIPGIPAKTLQASITGQQRTIRALSSLVCTPARPPLRPASKPPAR